MEEVPAVRRAAVAAVDDIEPGHLRDRIVSRLDDAAFAPGILTLVSADAARDRAAEPSDGLTDRAAGVQLIYEGLSLTRTLAHDDPWEHGDRDAADLDILIADILVSRGFYLLARTEAADDAVEVVRSFGSDQTVLRSTGDERFDANLETDVLELAVVAGVTAAGVTPTAGLREYAVTLSEGGFPDDSVLLDEQVRTTVATRVGVDTPASDGTEAAADH
jgi:hypothetical protein